MPLPCMSRSGAYIYLAGMVATSTDTTYPTQHPSTVHVCVWGGGGERVCGFWGQMADMGKYDLLKIMLPSFNDKSIVIGIQCLGKSLAAESKSQLHKQPWQSFPD